MKKARGFTLIEMLVVVVIITILMTIIGVVISNVVERAKNSKTVRVQDFLKRG